jgi:hypothetical protein
VYAAPSHVTALENLIYLIYSSPTQRKKLEFSSIHI